MKLKILWQSEITPHTNVYEKGEKRAIAKVGYRHGITARFANLLQIRRNLGKPEDVQRFMLLIREQMSLWNIDQAGMSARKSFGVVRSFHYSIEDIHMEAMSVVGVQWSKDSIKRGFPVGVRYFILCTEEEEKYVLNEYMHDGIYNPWGNWETNTPLPPT